MSGNVKLIYGHDPLCGWCYALIPALETFAKTRPNVEIELIMGGLMSGDRIRPYVEMTDYITKAFRKIKSVTGREPSRRFYSMLADPETGLIQSATPTDVLLQVKAIAPELSVAYAHELQKIHFEHGMSFNNAQTYIILSEQHGLPRPNIEMALKADDQTKRVERGYNQSKALGIRSYPTCLIMDTNNNILGRIDREYDPARFIKAFDQIVSRSNTFLEHQS